MLTRLREIVEKVASAPRLNEALNILVTDICLAMETEVCSVYLADHDRRCYYLMATRGLKNHGDAPSRSRLMKVLLAWSGDWRSQSTLPMRKNIPASNISLPSKRSGSALSLACRLFSAVNCLACLLSSNELRQYDESEESFLVTLATQMAAILSQSQLAALLGSIVIPASARFRPRRASRLPKAGWMPRSPDGAGL